ncbi:hypothetical protein H0X09_00835 [Candidatus Saccharibacteria bacterium]|nr:hypothetical protein [Candidatus Saccharibacteria bacterium]
MLRMSGSLRNQPVLSLHSGTQIAVALEPIINPHNLKILGWWCKSPGNGQLVLLAENLREIDANGLIVNDVDELTAPEDLVRHREVLDIRFQLLDKPVKTKNQKLGKVSDYSYNDGLFVQKLYVVRSLIKVFSSEDTVIVDRTQILEVTDHHILVRDNEIHATQEELSGATAPA